MIDPSVKLNEVQAERICKQTEDLYPYHPIVYKLKERLLLSNENCDPSKVESLLNGTSIHLYSYICCIKKKVCVPSTRV
jgi:hypothetical protein